VTNRPLRGWVVAFRRSEDRSGRNDVIAV